jgi:hypothetical protein
MEFLSSSDSSFSEHVFPQQQQRVPLVEPFPSSPRDWRLSTVLFRHRAAHWERSGRVTLVLTTNWSLLSKTIFASCLSLRRRASKRYRHEHFFWKNHHSNVRKNQFLNSETAHLLSLTVDLSARHPLSFWKCCIFGWDGIMLVLQQNVRFLHHPF